MKKGKENKNIVFNKKKFKEIMIIFKNINIQTIPKITHCGKQKINLAPNNNNNNKVKIMIKHKNTLQSKSKLLKNG